MSSSYVDLLLCNIWLLRVLLIKLFAFLLFSMEARTLMTFALSDNHVVGWFVAE